MQIIIIAALATNNIIGNNNKLPWQLPADLKHFRELTLGKVVIMGRKTYESIGKALPGRRNIVLSKNKTFMPHDCEVYSSLEQALLACKLQPEVFIIGGTAIYKSALPIATKMYLTLVHADVIGDTYFPQYNQHEWQISERQDFQKDEKNIYPYSFVALQRSIAKTMS